MEDLTLDPPKGPVPEYWELLSDTDKVIYLRLKADFAAGGTRPIRNNRLATFEEIVENIHQFAERGDENDWRRFLVCGVCWMDNAIAINTRQLRLLISKCKSSINGSLQKMGYTTHMSHSESWKILFSRIPLLKDHFMELRQWTIRYKSPATPPPPHIELKSPLPFGHFIQFSARDVGPPAVAAESPRTPTCPLKFRSKMTQIPDTPP